MLKPLQYTTIFTCTLGYAYSVHDVKLIISQVCTYYVLELRDLMKKKNRNVVFLIKIVIAILKNVLCLFVQLHKLAKNVVIIYHYDKIITITAIITTK